MNTLGNSLSASSRVLCPKQLNLVVDECSNYSTMLNHSPLFCYAAFLAILVVTTKKMRINMVKVL